MEARLALLIAAYGNHGEVRQAIEEHGSAAAARDSASLRARLKESLRRADSASGVARQLAGAAELGARWLLPGEPGYPPGLDATVLCVRGDVGGGPAVAVVGSRAADTYGRSVADALARALAGCGVRVVSGAAHGVDSAAHRGAVEAGGRTIAVLGTGMAAGPGGERGALLDEVAAHGAVVSEYLVFAHGSKRTFPKRNRLIARMSQATVVVQAARRSGALNTARHCREASLPLFAVPGDVLYPLSAGANDLLARGLARVFAHPRDLVEATGVDALRGAAWPTGERGGTVPWAQPGLGEAGLDNTAHAEPAVRVLGALSQRGPLSYDELVAHVPAVSAALMLDLELKGQVTRTPGGAYVATR